MFWEFHVAETPEAEAVTPAQGRFVMHRHCDADGPHLDLRLEQDGWLMGWRIDGLSLADAPWGTEKAPHSIRWLDQNGDAICEDAGTYAWIRRETDSGEIELHGHRGVRRVRVDRVAGLPAHCVREICGAIAAQGVSAEAAAGLIRDGHLARRRAIARLCGLGRELDGSGFDETVWRKMLDTRSLQEIHAHLEGYEVRFDRRYPPQPVSRPEPLPEEGTSGRHERVLAILQD